MAAQAEFDEVAPFYDKIRPAPSPEELGTLEGLLDGCTTILDAGVGTGRFAVALSARNYRVIGVDLSMGMIRVARRKGVGSLLRADVHHLPLPDRAVDAAFMANVLQLVPDPRAALAELGRVSRRTVVVLVSDWAEWQAGRASRELRERYRKMAAELGHPVPERARRYEHTLRQLRAIAPPKVVRVIPAPSLTDLTLDERLAVLETFAFGLGSIPAPVHAEIVRKMYTDPPLDRKRLASDWRGRFVAWAPDDLRNAA